MNTFSAKSIGLYGLAIGGSIVFFELITSYGEANIRAPIPVTGTYAISAPNLPDCLQSKQLLLDLQQSGIYLNASLIDHKHSIVNRDLRPTLSGQIKDRQLNISGQIPLAICPNRSRLRLTSSIPPGNQARRWHGQLWLTSQNSDVQSTATPTEFTAILQPDR